MTMIARPVTALPGAGNPFDVSHAIGVDDDQSRSHLTDLELLIASSAAVDVGPGYPQLTLPAWLRDVLWDTASFDLAYGFAPRVSAQESEAAHRDVLKAACRFVGIDEAHARNGFVTFSGSLALDRALASQLHPGDSAITTHPSIDIVTAMVRESPDVELVHVPTDETFHIDVRGIMRAIKPTTKAIILTSPENPTGAVVSTLHMKMLVDICIERDLTLMFDQCFATVNPYEVEIPLLPNYADDGLKWIFVWDTGKTFGLNEEKLGFIFCSDSVQRDIQNRMNVHQFGVSRRQKLLFRSVLDRGREERYVEHLNEVLRTNFDEVVRACQSLPVRPHIPEAGSFVLLDVSDAPGCGDDASFADRLLYERGVGVCKVHDFFYADRSGRRPPRWRDFVRLAAARDPEVMQEAMAKIAEFCFTLEDA